MRSAHMVERSIELKSQASISSGRQSDRTRLRGLAAAAYQHVCGPCRAKNYVRTGSRAACRYGTAMDAIIAGIFEPHTKYLHVSYGMEVAKSTHVHA